MTNGYHHHMFICSHERPPDASRECCAAKESLALMKALKFAAKQEGSSQYPSTEIRLLRSV